jgi:thioredoxin reductase
VEEIRFRLEYLLDDVASEVTLIHRRNEFRGALDSVEKYKLRRWKNPHDHTS